MFQDRKNQLKTEQAGDSQLNLIGNWIWCYNKSALHHVGLQWRHNRQPYTVNTVAYVGFHQKLDLRGILRAVTTTKTIHSFSAGIHHEWGTKTGNRQFRTVTVTRKHNKSVNEKWFIRDSGVVWAKIRWAKIMKKMERTLRILCCVDQTPKAKLVVVDWANFFCAHSMG